MRVRPFFWLLLVITCVGVFTFAYTLKTVVPASMQVHLEQPHPIAHTATGLVMHLADLDGTPIDQANPIATINMTDMDMGEQHQPFAALGRGNYETHFQPSMAGPWVMTILVYADGFAPLRQQVFIQVE